MKETYDNQYINLLEIDTFLVVKDTDFDVSRQEGNNNSTPHWISHMCDKYLESKDDEGDSTAIFSSDEIHQGECYYCHEPIPEAIIALWSLLEWEDAGDILHAPEDEIYQVVEGTP